MGHLNHGADYRQSAMTIPCLDDGRVASLRPCTPRLWLQHRARFVNESKAGFRLGAPFLCVADPSSASLAMPSYPSPSPAWLVPGRRTQVHEAYGQRVHGCTESWMLPNHFGDSLGGPEIGWKALV